jgi:hypothetical protein
MLLLLLHCAKGDLGLYQLFSKPTAAMQIVIDDGGSSVRGGDSESGVDSEGGGVGV